MAPLVVRGAGVRWTPLRQSAEAPTEPAGEKRVSGGHLCAIAQKHRPSQQARQLSRYCETEGIKDNKVFTKFVEYGIIYLRFGSEELPKTDRWFALLF